MQHVLLSFSHFSVTRQVFSNSVSVERTWRAAARCQPRARRAPHSHCGELVCALRAVKRLGSNTFKCLFFLGISGQEVKAVGSMSHASCGVSISQL